MFAQRSDYFQMRHCKAASVNPDGWRSKTSRLFVTTYGGWSELDPLQKRADRVGHRMLPFLWTCHLSVHAYRKLPWYCTKPLWWLLVPRTECSLAATDFYIFYNLLIYESQLMVELYGLTLFIFPSLPFLSLLLLFVLSTMLQTSKPKRSILTTPLSLTLFPT